MAQQSRITRADIEGSILALQGNVHDKVENRKQTILTGVAVAGVLVLLLFFLLGRRSGKKKTTIVEIRRV